MGFPGNFGVPVRVAAAASAMGLLLALQITYGHEGMAPSISGAITAGVASLTAAYAVRLRDAARAWGHCIVGQFVVAMLVAILGGMARTTGVVPTDALAAVFSQFSPAGTSCVMGVHLGAIAGYLVMVASAHRRA